MSYSDSLRHPEWQRKRLEIMGRDDFKCCMCGSGDKFLNVHHKTYLRGRKPWEYDNYYFLTLCEECHDQWHHDTNCNLPPDWEPLYPEHQPDWLPKCVKCGHPVTCNEGYSKNGCRFLCEMCTVRWME